MSLFSQLTSAKQGQRTQTGITDYCSSGGKKTLLNVLFNKIVNTCRKADITFYLEKKQNTGHTLGSMRWEHNKSPLLFIRPTYLKYVYLIKVVNLKINTSHKNQWHQYIWNGSLKKKKNISTAALSTNPTSISVTATAAEAAALQLLVVIFCECIMSGKMAPDAFL